MIDESIKQGKVKILILPLGHQSSPHCLNEDLQRATWASAMPPGVLVRWLLPSPDATTVEENSLGQVFIPVDPGPAGALEKTIRGLQWALKEYEFDYLIRTNSSSYFSPAQLLREVSGLPLQGLCKGVIGVTDDPRMGRFEFVSGAALMMSRDVVETLAMMDWTKHTDHLEDVEMSVYLAQNGVSFTPGERIELPDGQPLQCSGHVRLKSYALNRVTRRRMIEVHEIFAQPRGFSCASRDHGFGAATLAFTFSAEALGWAFKPARLEALPRGEC